MTNQNAYIHEFIDIRGVHRGDYMHHMTANWSPNAQEDRDQLCFGVWGVVGSTARWPQVCNIWEEPGLDGLARSFGAETVGRDLQDPKLAKWWTKASEFRKGGFDRIVLPAPWMPTITETLASGLRAEVCAHEIIKVQPGTAAATLELVRTTAMPAYEAFGWTMVGAWTTAMRDDDELIVLWALPSYDAWARAEAHQNTDEGLRSWRESVRPAATDWQRILLAASPLCPLRTGRQPTRDDRIDWEEAP